MSTEWLLIRGSGLAAFVMLAMAVIWGLLISTKVLGRAAKPKPVTWFHESLSIGALVATGVHLVALGLHDYIDFSWAEILVPGLSVWRPAAVALGVVAFYVLLVLTSSFYLKRWIGQRAWRGIHMLSFGLYAAALSHGIMAGTDGAHPAVAAMYAGFTMATLILIVARVARPAAGRPAHQRAGSHRRPAPAGRPR